MPTFRHGKNTKVLVGTFDLSNQFRDASSSMTADTAETSAFGSVVKTYVVGLIDGRLTLSGMFSGAAGEVDAVLSAALAPANENPQVVVHGMEGLALGRRALIGQAHETTYGVQGSIGDMVAVNAEFQATDGFKSGRVLMDPGTPRTVTGQEVGQDDGASSANGGFGVLNVIANTIATSAVFKIQHSSNSTNGTDGTWADLITFTTIGASALSAQFSKVTGTVNRWLRTQYTLTGAGSISAHVAFARNP